MRIKGFLAISILCLTLACPLNPALCAQVPYNPLTDILKQWNLRNEVISLGQDRIGLFELSALHEVMIDSGVRNSPAIALAILKEIEERKAELGAGDIIGLAEAAKRIAPDLPSVRFRLSSIYLSPKTLNIKNGFSELFKGADLAFKDPGYRLDLIMNMLYWTGIALVCSLIIFLASCTVKYIRPLHHLIGHLLPRIFSDLSIYAMIAGLSVFSFLYLGPLGLVLAIISLFWLFMGRSEKTIAMFFMVLAAMSPFLLDLPIYAAKYGSSTEKSMLSLELSPDYQYNASRFERLLAKNKDDIELKYSQALIQKRTGNAQASKELLFEITKARPNWDKAFVNLGNVEFLQGNIDSAISDYKKATTINASNFLAKFNLGKAFYRKTRLEDANQALANASDTDPVRFKELEDMFDPKNPKRYVFDETLTESDLKDRIKMLGRSDRQARTKLWKELSLYNAGPLASSGVVLSLVVILFILAGLSKKIDPPKRCSICGSSYCKRCSKTTDKRDICSQCYYIFVLRDSIDPTFKSTKEAQESKNKLTNSIFKNWISLFIPGFGNMYMGKAISGFLLSTYAAWALVFLIFRKGLVSDVYSVSLEPSALLPSMLISTALMLHILSNIMLRRIR